MAGIRKQLTFVITEGAEKTISTENILQSASMSNRGRGNSQIRDQTRQGRKHPGG